MSQIDISSSRLVFSENVGKLRKTPTNSLSRMMGRILELINIVVVKFFRDEIPSPFHRHSVSITSPFRPHSVSITSPFRLHSVSIPSPFRLHSIGIPSPIPYLQSRISNSVSPIPYLQLRIPYLQSRIPYPQSRIPYLQPRIPHLQPRRMSSAVWARVTNSATRGGLRARDVARVTPRRYPGHSGPKAAGPRPLLAIFRPVVGRLNWCRRGVLYSKLWARLSNQNVDKNLNHYKSSEY